MWPSPRTIYNTGAIAPLIACALICAAVAAYMRCGKRQEWLDIGRALLTASSLMAIIGVTLFRNEGAPSFSPSGIFEWANGGAERFVNDLGQDSEVTLNVLLFIPAALILTFRYRRPPIIFPSLVTLSLVLELTQGLLGLGNPDVSDVLSNSLGALIGVALASAWLCGTRYRNPILVWTASLAIAGIAAGVASAFPLARARQDHVERELRGRFRGTTVSDYRRWDSEGVLTARVFTLNETFSDGASVTENRAEVRFPINTLGLRMCVYGIWSPRGFEVRPASGSPCTTFMG